MKKLVLLLLAGGILATTSCRKTGPVGPQGPQGATGATGPAGQNGLDGNANVNGSNPFTVYGSDWVSTTTSYTYKFNVPAITADIVDYGIVQVFKSYGSATWTPLPDINAGIATVFDFTDGEITIYVQNTDGTKPSNPGNQVFRLVIISSSQKQAHPNTNWQNYDEAMSALNNTASASAAQ